MAKISKKTIENLREFLSRDCEYAATQEMVFDITTEVLRGLKSESYGDEIVLVDEDGEFSTVEEFADMFWDVAVKYILNVLATEE